MTTSQRKTLLVVVGVALVLLEGLAQWLNGTLDVASISGKLVNVVGGLQLGAALIQRPGDIRDEE